MDMSGSDIDLLVISTPLAETAFGIDAVINALTLGAV